MKGQSFEIQGHNVVQMTRDCVRKSLTEEVQDVALESIDEFLCSYDTALNLTHKQDVLLDFFKYYLAETMEGHVTHYSIIGDSRNNDLAHYGKKFNIDVSFTVKGALVATRITYSITYKNS